MGAPDQLGTRKGGEERMATFSPCLDPDVGEALRGKHLLVCKWTKATWEILDVLGENFHLPITYC